MKTLLLLFTMILAANAQGTVPTDKHPIYTTATNTWGLAQDHVADPNLTIVPPCEQITKDVLTGMPTAECVFSAAPIVVEDDAAKYKWITSGTLTLQNSILPVVSIGGIYATISPKWKLTADWPKVKECAKKPPPQISTPANDSAFYCRLLWAAYEAGRASIAH